MRFLTVVFSSHTHFMAHFSDKYPNGALFCRTKAEVELRDTVIVDISFPGLKQPARVGGQVISHSSGDGVWVHFDKHSGDTLAYLREFEASDLDRLSRAHPRYPASLNVRCRIDEDNAEMEYVDGHIIDLGPGGAFVSGKQAPMVGTRVSLDIGPLNLRAALVELRGQNSIRVDGRVAWVSELPDFKQGFGVRFDQRGAHGAAPLRALLRRSSEAGEYQF